MLRFLLPLLLSGCCFPHVSGGPRDFARLEGKVDRILAQQGDLQADLDLLVEAARRQGTGEITLFFPWNVEFLGRARTERLTHWLDHLVLEARGRPLHLVLVASAADWKKTTWNLDEAEGRLRAVRAAIDRQLMYVPHSFHRTYVLDPQLRPADSKARAWRQVRIIAVHDLGDLPALPAEAG